MAATLKIINARIETIAAAERVTKKELGLLSREIFEYTLEQWDAQVINRLLGVLTPVNKRTAVLYFKAFTPFKYVEETQVFGSVNKANDNKERCAALMQAFPGSDGTIWTWAALNINMETKEKDYAGLVTKSIKQALKSDTDRAAIIEAIFVGGVTSADIMSVLATMAQPEVAQEQAAVQ